MTQSTRPVVLTAQAINNTPEEGFPRGTDGGDVTWKTLLSSPKTPSNTFASGIARCAAKGGHLKCHRHAHPEMYYIVQGRGILSIDGTDHAVSKGSVIFIPGDSEHGIRNEGSEEDLVWLYVFAADKFADVVYRFDEVAPKAKL